MGLEGELTIGLHLHQGLVRSVSIGSTRADVARAMLQGRTRAEISAAVPLLFSVCGRSQAAASELACSAAGGATPTDADVARWRSAVAAEMLREGAWRTLLEWPQWLGEQPSAASIAAARAAQEPAPAAQAAVAQAVFGMSAAEWLLITGEDHLRRWAAAGETTAARFIHQLADGSDLTAADSASATPAVPLLASHDHASWVRPVARAADADAGFSSHPTLNHQPAETGALARLQDEPLVQALAAQPGQRVLARFVARLRELALLLLGQGQPACGALSLQDGSNEGSNEGTNVGINAGIGVGWVETARGLLIHQTRWQQGRAERYRIIAPTEWNFHPQGALPRALTGLSSSNTARLRQTATRLVQSLDPCVAFKLELHGA